MESTADNGRCVSLIANTVGNSGAGLAGILGAFFRGDSSSLAVHVEFSKIGDDIIGRGFAPLFNGGRAGGEFELDGTSTELVRFAALFVLGLAEPEQIFFALAEPKQVVFDLFRFGDFTAIIGGAIGTTGIGGAGRDGSVAIFFGDIVNPLKWPKNSFFNGDVGSSVSSEWLSSVGRFNVSGWNDGGPLDFEICFDLQNRVK